MYRIALSFDPCMTKHGGQSIVSEVNVSIATYCVLSVKEDLMMASSDPYMP